MDFETEQEVISIITKIIFLASSKDWDSEVASLLTQLFDEVSNLDKYTVLVPQILSHKPKMEFASLTIQIGYITRSDELKSEGQLLSLITQIVSLVSSMDLDLKQPKAESEVVISLIKKIITLFNSKPDSESELVSLITQTLRISTGESKLSSLISQLVTLKPEPELTSLVRHIISHFTSLNWEPLQFITVSPQFELVIQQGKFVMTTENVHRIKKKKNGECNLGWILFWRSARKEYFYCEDCNGEFHEEYEKAPLEIKHPLHPKHSLHLVSEKYVLGPRECYCCITRLSWICYYCKACDYAIKVSCVDKPRLLATDHPKWHEHTLAQFPSQASLPCNLCALTHSSCPFYICPPCDFVVHQKCLSLPRVIRISRHPHRLSFNPSFDKEDWICCVCRKYINKDYGGFSCVKKGCSYAAHSKCATQSNVWDGVDLEGVPEEIEEEIEPFVSIRDGIIQHFSHQQHHLRLDENTGRNYDDNKLCHACTTPIYFGNFYSCMECEFILHESCANLSRRIHHPVHPHVLTLVTNHNAEIDDFNKYCSVCSRLCSGFFYACDNKSCNDFMLNIQCATISEPLVNASHTHPLFLTSKPGAYKTCVFCYDRPGAYETFNCIECEFSLCFGCATIPQKVRYKHDQHILALSYGEEASTLKDWCEACEKIINPEEGFYKCDEYCCVTIHMKCLTGVDFYMKPGLSIADVLVPGEILVLPNNGMSRPICSVCKKRCPQKIVFKYFGFILCSKVCVYTKIRLALKPIF